MIKKIYFIGIGGTGMSGLANICIEKGYNVLGSDLKYSETIDYLKKKGANIKIGHKGKNITKSIDIIVYSTAINFDNFEIKMAQKLNISIWHRSKLLSYLSNKKIVYGIAGAHGKTTTTVMLAEIFNNAKKYPTVAAGGKLLFYGANGMYSKKSKIMIAELDESDGSFLNIETDSAIITNIDDDHLNYYHTKKEINKAFFSFAEKIKNTLIINGNDKVLKKITAKKNNVITFGFKNCDYIVKEINVRNYKNSGKVFYRNKYIGTINISLPGKHNLQNALGAIVLARTKGISDDIIFNSFATFKGVGRRFELIGQKNGIIVIDDYAHHPKEINALLTGVRSFGYKRIIAVFQPHRFSRTKQLFDDFVKVFKKADIVLINPIYGAGEEEIPEINSKILAKNIGKNAFFMNNFEETINYLIKNILPEDIILTIGAGDICEIGNILLSRF